MISVMILFIRYVVDVWYKGKDNLAKNNGIFPTDLENIPIDA
jgi:hypothetical protein